MTKRHNLIAIGLLVIVMLVSLAVAHFKAPGKSDGSKTITQSTPVPSPIGFDKTTYSIKEADSIWVIVNKQRKLVDGFKPPNLVVPKVKLRLDASSEQMQVRATIVPDMETMFKAASDAGFSLMLSSGYRSEAYQKTLYVAYVATQGQVAADRSSARPSHSEHQTGLTFDVEPADKRCELQQCFGDTPEGKWLATHAAEFGFIIRYGKDKEQLTGYEYEPWHMRYVGKALAVELVKQDQTMEQFFGLQPALNY